MASTIPRYGGPSCECRPPFPCEGSCDTAVPHASVTSASHCTYESCRLRKMRKSRPESEGGRRDTDVRASHGWVGVEMWRYGGGGGGGGGRGPRGHAWRRYHSPVNMVFICERSWKVVGSTACKMKKTQLLFTK